MAHLSKPEPSEIKFLFSTGSVFVDTQTGEKGILAAWVGLGGVTGLRKSSLIPKTQFSALRQLFSDFQFAI